MLSFNDIIRQLSRGQTPAYRLAKRIIKSILAPTVPVLPQFLRIPLRLFYEAHFLVIAVFRSILTMCYYNPLLQARCASFGREVSIDGMVFVNGPVEIHVGDRVKFGGKVNILSGGVLDTPRLIMKDHSGVGWNTTIIVNREVVLEEDVIVAPGCHISDSDGHPREADLRAQGRPPFPEDIRPVRICRYAWIGTGAYIMKGVTIGEGCIIAANSVVLSSIPPYCLAMGNPAEVLFRNYGRPSTERKPRTPRSPVPPPNAA